MNKNLPLIVFLLLSISFISYSQKDWVKVSEPGTNICITSAFTGYYFVNEKVGSHGSKYTLYKSENGMESFSMVKTKIGDFGCYSLDNMFFIDNDTGIIVEICQGIADLFITENGGQDWSDMGAGGTYDMALYFQSSHLGYYSFYPGSPNNSFLIYYNNGVSSTIMQTTDYIFNAETRMNFVNDSTGFVICKSFMDNAIILKIENYGASWEQSYFLPMNTEFRDLIFIDENTGFVVGSNGIILKTEDQGANWYNTATLPAGELNSIDYSNGILHVVGDNGHYIRSDDEGQTWTSHPLAGAPYNLIYTRFFNGYDGYILNENGELYTNFTFPGVIEREMNVEYSIFPNPVEDILNIKLKNSAMDYKIEIIDLTGKVVLRNENKHKLSLPNLREGIYFVRLDVGGKTVVKKFVKK
ncbi:T9SS type A sorting domain-containing protein [Bacteroidota bacterium]